LFPVANIRELSRALEYALENLNRCSTLIKNAYNRAEDFFIESIIDMYKSALKEKWMPNNIYLSLYYLFNQDKNSFLKI